MIISKIFKQKIGQGKPCPYNKEYFLYYICLINLDFVAVQDFVAEQVVDFAVVV
jgi:hypothetical protein